MINKPGWTPGALALQASVRSAKSKELQDWLLKLGCLSIEESADRRERRGEETRTQCFSGCQARARRGRRREETSHTYEPPPASAYDVGAQERARSSLSTFRARPRAPEVWRAPWRPSRATRWNFCRGTSRVISRSKKTKIKAPTPRLSCAAVSRDMGTLHHSIAVRPLAFSSKVAPRRFGWVLIAHRRTLLCSRCTGVGALS